MDVQRFIWHSLGAIHFCPGQRETIVETLYLVDGYISEGGSVDGHEGNLERDRRFTRAERHSNDTGQRFVDNIQTTQNKNAELLLDWPHFTD